MPANAIILCVCGGIMSIWVMLLIYPTRKSGRFSKVQRLAEDWRSKASPEELRKYGGVVDAGLCVVRLVQSPAGRAVELVGIAALSLVAVLAFAMGTAYWLRLW